jgi:hypothetical protein
VADAGRFGLDRSVGEKLMEVLTLNLVDVTGKLMTKVNVTVCHFMFLLA